MVVRAFFSLFFVQFLFRVQRGKGQCNGEEEKALVTRRLNRDGKERKEGKRGCVQSARNESRQMKGQRGSRGYMLRREEVKTERKQREEEDEMEHTKGEGRRTKKGGQRERPKLQK